MDSVQLRNKHRHFVQFMLSRGSVSVDKAKGFCYKIDPALLSNTNFQSFLNECNAAIHEHSFKIETAQCEVTGTESLVWINGKFDQISEKSAYFTTTQLEYFHAIMREITSSSKYRIPYPRAINISSTLTKNLSRTDGSRLLESWINSGYLVKEEGNLFLGARTILEFAGYLRAHLENCSCELCSELCLVGKICESCEKKYHSNCIEKYLRRQTSCPHCKTQWEARVEDSDEEDST